MSNSSRTRRGFCTLFVLASISAALAHASATLLLEEPYGKLGFFTATGHAAVYLSNVCAENPLKLRPCKAGELGAVISRYDGVGGDDWVAIPLIPYLYAVEKTDDIPLFVDPKMVSFLRNQYRISHLEAVAPDSPNGEVPGGNWYELIGSAYDRTAYAFEIETSPAKDLAFIRLYNARPNESHFRTVSHNCADFAKDVINFYYPKALHRSVVADVGITTPKQMAKTMVKYSSRHPRLKFSRYVIPQIPGTSARSSAVHGVVESFLKSKKYIVPSAVVSPVFAGCVLAVYEGTGAGRFDPGLHALVYNADRGLEPPVDEEDRRSYQIALNHIVAADLTEKSTPTHVEKTLAKTINSSTPTFDAAGRPAFRMDADELMQGVTAHNLLTPEASNEFVQKLLEARLHEELRKGKPPKISESDIEQDWKLLEKSLNISDSKFSSEAHPSPANLQTRLTNNGNRP
jgi:hypothetical protein